MWARHAVKGEESRVSAMLSRSCGAASALLRFFSAAQIGAQCSPGSLYGGHTLLATAHQCYTSPVPRYGRGRAPVHQETSTEAPAAGEAAIEPLEVALPGDFDRERCFAIRASGSSMQGWRAEIRDGDWLVLRWARGDGLASVQGKVALVARGDPAEGRTYHLKRIVAVPRGFELRSDNPAVSPMPARADDQVIAALVATIRPEDLAPRPGAMLSETQLAEAFGLSEAPHAPMCRVDGHLFLFAESRESTGSSTSYTYHIPVPDRRPAETAFVLERQVDARTWSYRGVARWDEGRGGWEIGRPR